MRTLFILSLLLGVFVSSTARAEPRVALVIGNSSYEQIGMLANPSADATLIAGSLRDLGFDVTQVIDGTQDDMKRGIVAFGRALRAAGSDATGLFYYAGHGIQTLGTNYLLPVDAEISHSADLDVVAVEANWVLRQMYSARNRTNIIILDACRNNPFEAIDGLADQGLAEMNAPPGSFISYATAPGSVAYDGDGAHSPFTMALAEQMRAPGANIEMVFKRVRIAVHDMTGGLQTPWDSSSLTGDFMFQAAAPVDPATEEERLLWRSVRDSGDAAQLLLFLRGYPDSDFAPEARERLRAIVELELAEAPRRDVAPASEPTSPTPEELALIETAQGSGLASDYAAYLEAYPEGVFASLALAEIAASRSEPAAPAPRPEPEAAPEPVDKPVLAMRYTLPLAQGGDAIVGQSIAQLATGSPLFPPVEGLPEAYWKDQSCANCHQWTAESLCDQGRFYVKKQASRSLGKQHPYGGGFKAALREWAQNDCQE